MNRGTSSDPPNDRSDDAAQRHRLGKAIEMLRVGLGLDQEDLANGGGPSKASISRVESGASVRPSTIEKTIGALGIDPELVERQAALLAHAEAQRHAYDSGAEAPRTDTAHLDRDDAAKLLGQAIMEHFQRFLEYNAQLQADKIAEKIEQRLAAAGGDHSTN